MGALVIRYNKHENREKAIEIREMLGKVYLLNDDESSTDKYAFENEFQYSKFTIEEFFKKYPYRVGDKVYNIIHNENQTITKLSWDSQENEVIYQTNNNEFVYVNYLQPYKKEIMEGKPNLLQRLKEYFEDTPREVVEKEWHEYDKYNEIGPSVDEYLEYVSSIRQPQYPKTYEECCKVLGCKADDFSLILAMMAVMLK